MRVVIAPDKFAGTLTAAEAASAIANGWRSAMPADDLVLTPMSDGGHGFLDTIASVFAGRRETNVDDALGRAVGASWLFTTVAGTPIAVIESAQACGISRLTPEQLDPLNATSYGVGQLIGAALASGARRILVGLGGTATNDGGAGMAQALGVRLLDADGNDLPRVPARWSGSTASTSAAWTSGCRTSTSWRSSTCSTRCSAPTAPPGRSPVRRGADEAMSARLEAPSPGTPDSSPRPRGSRAPRTSRERAPPAGSASRSPPSPARRFTPGSSWCRTSWACGRRSRTPTVVVTGEGRFDAQSLRGKVPSGIAALAGEAGLPCIVLAGDVTVGRQEMRAAGITGAYSVTDLVGSQGEALAKPAHWLEKLAAQAAREWSRPAGESSGPAANPTGQAPAGPPAGPPDGEPAGRPQDQPAGSDAAPPSGMRS
jgi:glycerate kinase